MKKWLIAAAALLPLVAVDTGAAQQLEAGKWTGTVLTGGGNHTNVTYNVAMKGDTITITVNAGEHGTYPFSDVKLKDRTLTFWFTPGPRVECTLTRRDDGAYEGTCSDGGDGAKMVMVPPKKE